MHQVSVGCVQFNNFEACKERSARRCDPGIDAEFDV